MKFELNLRRKDIPKEELIADLKRVAALTSGASVSHRSYSSTGTFSSDTIVRQFGSWNEALNAAGLEIKIRKDISKEELFENLANIWQAIGRQPVFRDVEKSSLSKFSKGTYVERFGSWNGALQAFIDYIESDPSEATPPFPVLEKKTSASRTNRQINWRLRASILIRDNCICKMCGASPAKNSDVVLHVDHIIPYSKGGETLEENLRTLCSICNIGRSNHFAE